MVFKLNAPIYSTELQRKEGETILYINYLGASIVPSVADSAEVMGRVIDALIDNPEVSRVILVQQRNYNYPFEQVSMLLEIAQLYTYLLKQERILAPDKLGLFSGLEFVPQELSYFLSLLRQDPGSCYLEVLKKILLYKRNSEDHHLMAYVGLLERLRELLVKTKFISSLIDVIDTYAIGDRKMYYSIFRPDILPNFTFTRLVAQIPENAELIDQYEIHSSFEDVNVMILKVESDSKYLYHIMPPEYSLSEEHHYLLNLGKNVLLEYQPKSEEFVDSEKVRALFFNIARDLLSELSQNKRIPLNYRELNGLAKILVRQTIGFGLIEVLLFDDHLQDVFLNSPVGQNYVFVRHSKHGDCVTNILPSYEDADSWASKLRLQSGRPLDEANPILDTDIFFGNVRARVAAIQRPLSPTGIAYALRRHREDPWTLPLFINNKMINSFTAGLLSFLIDGNRTMLIAGTRSSGKTSLLGSLMLEVIPSVRTLVIEDSVTGDSQIIIKENGKFRKTTIGEIIDKKIEQHGFVDIDGREKELNINNIEIFSINKEGKVVLSKASKFIRHKTNKQIYEVTTTSGKKIKVTEDHSLFTLDEKNIFKTIKPKDIKENSFIAIPRNLPFDNSIDSINLLEHLDKLKNLGKNIFVLGEGIEDFILENRKKLFDFGYSLNYSKSTIQNWINKKILPLSVFENFIDNIKTDNLLLKSDGGSQAIPSRVFLDENLLSLIGLWLADGCYDKNSIIISVVEEENRSIVRTVAEKFGVSVKMHSDGFSLLINSVLFKEVMKNIFELKGDSYTKQMPSWAYNLSNRQMGWLLKGFFSGDGCASDKEVVFSSCSRELIKDITNSLLRFDIVLRTNLDLVRSDKTFNCRIGNTYMLKSFKEHIGFIVKSKQDNLNSLCSRISTHDTTDIIPLSNEVKIELNEILGSNFNSQDYIKGQSNIGINHLSKLLELVPFGITNPIDPLRKIVKSDIFWDKVKTIKKVNNEDYVYDISVPGNENFICENILAHNTLELPVDSLRKLGYNIQRMKVRSALLESTTEVEASEGIRASLRLGDSALIVGEVRSSEAKALYEAMRVGALANLVAGTIHGASPYGVFDRVVNDLGVPVTSFKATDIIAVANPIRTPDGLHYKKRVVQIAEVRKHWTKDPEEEKGFVDLVKYNVEKDELEPSDDLMNGDSEIVKEIAGAVKGWAGNWDAVWDNILLRGKIKQEIVDVSKKLQMPLLMESKFNSLSNDVFHRISEKVTREIGLPVSERVFPEWRSWLMNNVRKV